MNAKRIIYFVLSAFIFSACSNTKYLAANQDLYVGAKIKFDSSDLSKSKKKDLTNDLKGLLRPKPNSTIIGLRVKLWAYNIAGTPTGHGLKYWLKNKFGEPPVIASYPALEKNRGILQNRLENIGFFKDTVALDTSVKNKKLTAVYTATTGPEYTIRNVTFPLDSSVLSTNIQKATDRFSFLKPGKPYNLDVIKEERQRIDAHLKNNGFFYFSPDYLLDNVDSTVGTNQVDMDMRVKPETPYAARVQYKINDVVVFADYDISSDTTLPDITVKHVQGYNIIDPNNKFNPKIFTRTLVFKPGDLYQRKDHNLSLNRLTTLGVYKFVKARFEPVDTVRENSLNAFYYLTPTERKSIRFEVSALTKSNNATGTELSINWRNRNLLKGAELFTASLYGGYEKQVSSGLQVTTKRVGVDLNLYIPRIIAPFRFQTNSAFVPRTKINVGYEVFNRTSQYLLTSAKAGFGYQWKENNRTEHQLTVLNINYVQPKNITDSFQRRIDTNVSLRRSIEKQFIFGSIYNYNYNTQLVQNYKKNNYYFNGNLDLSGNIYGLLTGADIENGKQGKLFNIPFSQYIRAEADFRYYRKLGNQFRTVNARLTGGIGYAYGNSVNLPFVKSFFAGGVNDIRAFRARSLGPGSYYAGNPKDSFVAEQPGDIKLEMNLEYRAKLFSIVRWAAFIDAGNTWTRKEDIYRPGSKFTNKFLDQVAIGGGLGLRFDVSILLLRLDVAVPFRNPAAPEGSKWVISQTGFNKFVYNIAIGYPF